MLLLALCLSCAPGDCNVTGGGATKVPVGNMVMGNAGIPVTLSSITVTPASPSVVATTQQFTATGHYSDGSTQDITTSAAWTSGTPATATINASTGLATTVAAGTSTITATLSAISGSTTETVAQSVNASINLATGASTFGGGTHLTIAVPFWLPSDATQVTLWIGNFYMTPTLTTASQVTGVDVAVGTSNGSGTGYSGSPTTFLSQTIPGDGTYLKLTASVTRGSDGNIIIAYTMPGGFTYGTTANITWGLRSTTGLAVNPLPAGMSSNTGMGYMVRVQYRTNAKRVVVLGDSIVVGYRSTRDVAAYYLGGPNQGYSVDASGVISSKFSSWEQNTHYTDNQNYSGAVCLQEVGVNDLPSWTEAQYESAVTTNAALLKGSPYFCSKYYVQTPTPGCYPANETRRQNELTWLRAGGIANVDGILDADAVWNDGTNNFKAAYDSGDDCHPNAAGHAALNTAMGTLIN